MKTRVLVPEWMDAPDLGREDHHSALRGLGRINHWTRNAALVWRHVAALARRLSRKRLRILDVATGGADVPLRMLQYARRLGIELEIHATDVSPQALEFAAANCDRAGVSLRLLTLDVLREEIDERYDLVMCSQFLHHLTDDQTAFALRNMAGAAVHRVVAVDLVRSRWNWWQVWLATRALSRSKIVHFDGPQSIRAAYTVREMATLAREIGFVDFAITRHWPCRFVLVGDLDDRD